MGGPTNLLGGFVSIHPKKTLRIIFGNLEYASAMLMAGLDPLTARKAAASKKFNQKTWQCPPS